MVTKNGTILENILESTIKYTRSNYICSPWLPTFYPSSFHAMIFNIFLLPFFQLSLIWLSIYISASASTERAVISRIYFCCPVMNAFSLMALVELVTYWLFFYRHISGTRKNIVLDRITQLVSCSGKKFFYLIHVWFPDTDIRRICQYGRYLHNGKQEKWNNFEWINFPWDMLLFSDSTSNL